MKQIITNYTYSSSGKTVTLTDFSSGHPVALERLQLIVDVTTNQILYNFADSTVATAAISSNNVITLSAIPGGTSNSDKIQVTYDVVIGDPTYETPLLASNASQETGGNLATLAGAVSASKFQVAGTVTSTLLDATPSTVNITAQDSVSTTTAMANSQNFITGTPTAGSSAAFSLSSQGSLRVLVTGTWTGTLVTEMSIDSGTTWLTIGVHQTGTAYASSSFTANFSGNLNVGASTNFRVRSTAAWTGTAIVRVVESVNPASIYIANTLKISDATIPTQQLAINSSGQIGISNFPSTQAVSGTITANAGTNLNTSALALETGGNLAILSGAVASSVVQTNVKQINGVTTSMGNGTTDTGTQRVTLSSDSTGLVKLATGANTIGAVTQSGTWTVQPGNTPNTSPWLTSLNDGTNTANVIAGDSGQNSQTISGARKEVSFTTTTAQAVAATDVSNYRWACIQVTTNGTNSVVNFQGSNDDTNWFQLVFYTNNSGQNGGVNSVSSAANMATGALNCRYFRLNVTGISAGTTAGIIEFFATPALPSAQGVAAAQAGTWTVQPGNTANTTAWLVNAGTVPTGTALNQYEAIISSNTTTTVTASTAYITDIVLNTTTGGTTSTITIQDGQGTPQILVNGISTTAVLTSPTILTFSKPIKMTTGIKIVTAGAVAATVAVWINYCQ